MVKELMHSVVLIITVFLGFLLPQSSLSKYDIQLIAFLFIVLYLKKRLFRAKNRGYRGETKLLESFVFTLIILIVINTTGGLYSQYFFLIYFLLFSLSLLLEPVISLVASISLVVFFLLSGSITGASLTNYISIFSLVFMTPFALFLGQEYLQNSEYRIQNQKISNSLARTKEDTLLFLSLLIKNQIKSIKNTADNFQGDSDLSEIKKVAQKMEANIDKFEKEI